ncbi:hypothetical protein [Streptomyces sp. MI02-7b]|uniref:hypothetical protein n=1 Tax=Streptomyces sp. MI02-7b TaxID=462941 RepID=UPI0029B2DFD9|nr:hypothetical protein [Streptomyces sp. MI02-7b]MDX3078400.1 hypothetical protein [Streptomyces sp. MI02-7b]
MIAIMALYQRLVKVQAPLLPALIRQEAAELPSPAHWALALADIAATDSYPVNRDPSITQELRFAFIAHLLDFVDQEVRLRHPHLLARKYLAYARLAIEDDLENVPEDLTPDSAVARALSCFPLTRTQALTVAKASRARYLHALTAGIEGEEFQRAVAVDGSAELNTITNLLHDMQYFFTGKLSKPEIAHELQAWSDIIKDLGLGETVHALLMQRMNRRQNELRKKDQ